MSNKICIYTAIFGNYEPINETLPDLNGIDLICFTDSEYYRSEKWNVIHVNPYCPGDSPRSQRHVKICPHDYNQLSTYSTIIYIDNSICFTQAIVDFIDKFERSSHAVQFMLHSYRSSLFEEFVAVYNSKRDKPSSVLALLEFYADNCPELLGEQPVWGGIIARKHHCVQVHDFNEDWFSMVLKYSARDQLSLLYSVKNASALISLLPLDNFRSYFHTWPHILNRRAYSLSPSRLFSLPFPVVEGINYSLFERKLAIDHELGKLKIFENSIIKAANRRQAHYVRARYMQGLLFRISILRSRFWRLIKTSPQI